MEKLHFFARIGLRRVVCGACVACVQKRFQPRADAGHFPNSPGKPVSHGGPCAVQQDKSDGNQENPPGKGRDKEGKPEADQNDGQGGPDGFRNLSYATRRVGFHFFQSMLIVFTPRKVLRKKGWFIADLWGSEKVTRASSSGPISRICRRLESETCQTRMVWLPSTRLFPQIRDEPKG